jgi:hypothetical protein
MYFNKVNNFWGKASSFLTGAALALVLPSLGLSGCGTAEGDVTESAEEEAAPELGEVQEAITGGWTNLSLRNGWKVAANSNTPAVGLVNGIVTFRGAIDGTQATSRIAFCLTAPTFTKFRPTDAGYLTIRAALANANYASLGLDFPFTPQIPENDRYCVSVNEDGVTSGIGANAKIRTSLEGASYDKSFADSTHIDYGPGWGSAYPHRGSDSTINPGGQGIFAKLVNGFVRFQGVTAAPQDTPFVIFTLTNPAMIPGKTAYVPVHLSPPAGVQGTIAIQPNGQVVVQGASQFAWQGVSLDGASYSKSSPPEAKNISLSSGWVAHSVRPVRARIDGGVVRLEGAVKNGTSTTVGTLPTGMWPAKTIYLVANAIQFAQPAQLSINTSGVIKVLSPFVAATPGLSLDGVSFGQ